MHALQRPFKVFLEICKGPGQRAGSRNQDIVVVRTRRAFAEKTHCGAQTPFNAVALDGSAHLLGYRKSEPRRRRLYGRNSASPGFGRGSLRAGLSLQNERGRCAPCAAPNSQEFSSFLESDQRQSHVSQPRRMDKPRPGSGSARTRERGLGRQTLAALGAATRDDLDATGSLHAGTEAVAALANELAGLISAFHRNNSVCKIEQHRGRPMPLPSADLEGIAVLINCTAAQVK